MSYFAYGEHVNLHIKSWVWQRH